MKNMKKILALALVVMSVMAIALPAMAAGWESRYGPGELNSNSNYAGVHRHFRNLQKDLIKLGYDLGPDGADGYYGSYTKAAVRAFQRNNGLSVDGITVSIISCSFAGVTVLV